MNQDANAAQALAERAAQALYAGDRASQRFGIKITAIAPGEAQVAMRVSEDMLNGHQTCHGGLLFTLADSAFAFACNTHGDTVVAAGCSIDFLAPARSGDELLATAKELWRGGRSGLYEVVVSDQRGERLALFRGRSHRVSASP